MALPHGDACSAIKLPNGASLSDGLSEDEAVLIALWNNASFREVLADVRLAESDLVAAGMLPNPEIAFFLPMAGKPFKYALDFPLEALWLRPMRLRAAQHESVRTAERVTQAALDLVRDVRKGHADARLAEARAGVSDEAVQIRKRLAKLAVDRLAAGDASRLEASFASAEAARAEHDAVRAHSEVMLASIRLARLLGIGPIQAPIVLVGAPAPTAPALDPAALVLEAQDTRPDALAAAEQVVVASERVRLARSSQGRVLGILDATSGDSGHVPGPAVRATLPLFHRNEGGILRAEAELDRARRQQESLQQRIAEEVQLALARYALAKTERELTMHRLLPPLEAAVLRSEDALEDSPTGYVLVLESVRQLLDARLRAAQATADLQSAWAELERSVGRRLAPRAETVSWGNG